MSSAEWPELKHATALTKPHTFGAGEECHLRKGRAAPPPYSVASIRTYVLSIRENT